MLNRVDISLFNLNLLLSSLKAFLLLAYSTALSSYSSKFSETNSERFIVCNKLAATLLAKP
jgi:predicted CDP-diglyceride synthetase/phosphatidate cytidylyltransferase